MPVFEGKERSVPFHEFSIEELLSRVNNKEILLLQLGLEAKARWTFPQHPPVYSCNFDLNVYFSTFEHFKNAPQKNVRVYAEVHYPPRGPPVAGQPDVFPAIDDLQAWQQYGIMETYAMPQYLLSINTLLKQLPGLDHLGEPDLFNLRRHKPPSYIFHHTWMLPETPPCCYSSRLNLQTHLPLTERAAKNITPEKIYEIFKALPNLEEPKTILVRSKQINQQKPAI